LTLLRNGQFVFMMLTSAIRFCIPMFVFMMYYSDISGAC
jgi:hypothetical protein